MISSAPTAKATAPDRTVTPSDPPAGDAATFATLLAVLLPGAGSSTAATRAPDGASAVPPATTATTGTVRGEPDRPAGAAPATATPPAAVAAAVPAPTPAAVPVSTPAAVQPAVPAILQPATPAMPAAAAAPPPSTEPEPPRTSTATTATTASPIETTAAAGAPEATPVRAATASATDTTAPPKPDTTNRAGEHPTGGEVQPGPGAAAAGEPTGGHGHAGQAGPKGVDPRRPAEPAATTARPEPATAAPSRADAVVPPADTHPSSTAPTAPASPSQVAPAVRAHDATPAHATAAPTPARPTAMPPHSQVASLVAGLRREPDGAYRLSLHLHPDELGPVHVEVELRGGEVALHLDAETDAARAALRDSLGDLRAELEAGGLHARSLDVAERESGHAFHDHARPARRASPGPGSAAEEDQPPLVASVTTTRPTDAALDLRL